MSGGQGLPDVLGEFLGDGDGFPVRSILYRLVGSVVDVLPISSADVTLVSPAAMPRYGAASDASPLRFEELQTELGEGPCLAAYHGDEPVGVPDRRHGAPTSTQTCSPHSVFPVPAQRPSRG